ncbi:citrate transporter family protein [Ochrobactrum quorumnocens]|uniref:Citrate transporter family protein n=1 Tax=Ochrobactrum quorumnocens TaxID=271865 RepID=A0A248U9M2_9HYPH|nr:SLC13 family permease [[Ochrobactrum] quorumnocens]ASV83366.1 citrate transporter family protein [[Ochrobactrum] quorumnocens]
MTHPQILSFAVIILMMGAFIWGKFRYDIVALCSLLLAVAVGVVPFDQAFTGFSDDIVIIVGSALIVSAGVARSGLMQEAVQRFLPEMNSVRLQLAVLVAIVTVLSAFVKNVGALAIMIPVAFQFARRSNVSPSTFLMPMAFGALLGGLMTQVGTSPNIVVSRIRGEMVGEPFTMFDFTPVGAVLAAVGLIYLVTFYWLVPERTRESVSLDEAIKIKNYASEASVAANSSVIGKRISDLIKPAEGEAMVTSIIRKTSRITPLPDTVLLQNDVVLLEGDPKALDLVVSSGKLSLSKNRNPSDTSGSTEIEAVEAVIGTNSRLVGLNAQQLDLYARHEVNLLAVSRPGVRISERLSEVRLNFGDVVVLQGRQASLSTFLTEFELLPLARRKLMLGSVRRGLIPLAILIAAIGATALSLVPVAVAFFAAAVAMLLFKVIPINEVYDEIDGPILVMLAALIPVSDALRTTGGTELIAQWLSSIGHQLPPAGALALILVTAMMVTPFLNNAATVLVMAPIATSFASGLGFRPEAFLMAVAIGAGCDFLTPIGHQCNTLVMGPGGYRFSDYPRLGLPLSIIIALVTIPTLMFFWPLK